MSRVIADNCPKATSEHQIKEYFGRKVAIDASMSIYQFLIAVRTGEGTLTNEQGDTTSHLMGLFYRTLRLIEEGLKPVYVFDGKPPEAKAAELERRGDRRQEAARGQAEAADAGDHDLAGKMAKRTVKVTSKHVEECKELLKLMGIPYVQAVGEAEAQCADMAKRGLVYAVGSEDMDTLTFGAPILLRHLTFSEARKMPIVEIKLEQVLEGLQLTMDEFIDLCVLLGCDYCGTVKGVGPAKAVNLIKNFRSIERLIQEKAIEPDGDYPFKTAQALFKAPLVLPPDDPQLGDIRWTGPGDVEALVDFMCKQHGFNEKRIRMAVDRLRKLSMQSVQKRVDDFFRIVPGSAAGAGTGSGASAKASKDKLKKEKENKNPKKVKRN